MIGLHVSAFAVKFWKYLNRHCYFLAPQGGSPTVGAPGSSRPMRKKEAERQRSLDIERWLKSKFREGFTQMKANFEKADEKKVQVCIRPWPMTPKRFTFFQIVRDQTLTIDFGQFEGADSEFKCCQACNPAVFA